MQAGEETESEVEQHRCMRRESQRLRRSNQSATERQATRKQNAISHRVARSLLPDEPAVRNQCENGLDYLRILTSHQQPGI
jgi:hypothetical protein